MTTTSSATLDPVTTSAEATKPSYWRLWKRVPQELGFLILTLPIAVVGFSVSVSLFSAGVGTLVTFFLGVIVLAALLYISRGFGLTELYRLEWAGRPRIERPEWQDLRVRQGFWGWLRSLFGNGHYWLYLLHTMVISFPISLFSWIFTVVWVSTGLGGISYWFWERYLPENDSQWHLSSAILTGDGFAAGPGDPASLDIVVNTIIGIVMVALIPFITRGLVLMHYGIAKVVLGAFRSDALQRELLMMGASRTAAVSAEGTALRRLERDIHDGPQQRLVRLQMDLASADRQLAKDPEKARELIAEAMDQSREALEELRALSRGFAPPILLDRGLVAALESLAVRSPVPVRVESRLPEGTDLPVEIERNAYFVVSELLTNVVKHSEATEASVLLELRRVPEPDATWVDVTVTDNGHGGAERADAHGLAGLDERLRGLGGILEIVSPDGGPTVAIAHLPVTY